MTVDVSALLGDWVNTDQPTPKGPLRLSVSRHGEDLSVRAYGAGSPQPHDWGQVPAVVCTAPGTPSVAWSFSAEYDFGSLRTVVSAYHKTGILVATTSSLFRDGGGIWSRSFFHRDTTARTVDPAPLVGRWVNFDTHATGIHQVDASAESSRLMLRISERGEPASVCDATLPAVPLADDIDATEAMAFLSEGPLGPHQVILCGYLNRGLLTIDVHSAGTQPPGTMYRAHFYRTAPP